MPRKNGKPVKNDARCGDGRRIAAAHHWRRVARPPDPLPAGGGDPADSGPGPRDCCSTGCRWTLPAAAAWTCTPGSGALGLEALSRGAARGRLRRGRFRRGAASLADTCSDLQCDRGAVVTADAEALPRRSRRAIRHRLPRPAVTPTARSPTSAGRIERAAGSEPGGLVYLEDAAAAGPPDLPRGLDAAQEQAGGRGGLSSGASRPTRSRIARSHGQPCDVSGDLRSLHQRAQRPRPACLPHLRPRGGGHCGEPGQGAAVHARAAHGPRAARAGRRAERRGRPATPG